MQQHGLPVVNTQESEEYRRLVNEYQIGINVQNGDSKDLADKIEILYNDKTLREKFGANNRKLAEEKFDRKNTYRKIIEIIESQIIKYKYIIIKLKNINL